MAAPSQLGTAGLEGNPLLARWLDGTNCALRRCKRKLITSDDDAVAVATDESLRKRLSKKTPSEIDWQASGRQAFHRQCWDKACAEKSHMTRTENKMVDAALESAEYFDSLPSLVHKVRQVGSLLEQVGRKGFVVFTGAGISDAAGIPTYRGTAGIDTMEELHHESDSEEEATDYTKLEPTATHRTIAGLEKDGIVSFVVTQNCDNLHVKGGTSRGAISELHGNVFIEYCELCDTEYTRDYEVDAFSTDCHNEPWFVECEDCGWNHFTGRKCSRKGCNGRLRDTIVNFGDPLHSRVLGGLAEATEQFAKATVCLAIGSSLSVCPANSLPRLAQFLVIVNPQHTGLDKHASLRINSTSDAFMTLFSSVASGRLSSVEFECPPANQSKTREYNRLRRDIQYSEEAEARRKEGALESSKQKRKKPKTSRTK